MKSRRFNSNPLPLISLLMPFEAHNSKSLSDSTPRRNSNSSNATERPKRENANVNARQTSNSVPLSQVTMDLLLPAFSSVNLQSLISLNALRLRRFNSMNFKRHLKERFVFSSFSCKALLLTSFSCQTGRCQPHQVPEGHAPCQG